MPTTLQHRALIGGPAQPSHTPPIPFLSCPVSAFKSSRELMCCPCDTKKVPITALAEGDYTTAKPQLIAEFWLSSSCVNLFEGLQPEHCYKLYTAISLPKICSLSPSKLPTQSTCRHETLLIMLLSNLHNVHPARGFSAVTIGIASQRPVVLKQMQDRLARPYSRKANLNAPTCQAPRTGQQCTTRQLTDCYLALGGHQKSTSKEWTKANAENDQFDPQYEHPAVQDNHCLLL
jgi:hypothetical protein